MCRQDKTEKKEKRESVHEKTEEGATGSWNKKERNPPREATVRKKKTTLTVASAKRIIPSIVSGVQFVIVIER